MSIRTIIEINHDMLHELKRDPEIMQRLVANLGSTHYSAELNIQNADGKPVHVGNDIRIALQRHHSTNVSVSTEYVTVKL